MEGKNLIGKNVTHKSLGKGIVTKIENERVYVSFPGCTEEKKFIYPFCFTDNLTLSDEDLAWIQADILNAKLKEQKKQEEKAKQYQLNESLTKKNHHGKNPGKQGQKTPKLQTFQSVEDFCNHFESDLIGEISYLKSNGGKKIRITDGDLIEKKNGKYQYLFASDAELNYPDGTQITIWVSGSGVPGSVIFCEEFSIAIATDTFLGKHISSIEFSAEPWILLQFLIERLHELQEEPQSAIARSLICDGRKNMQYHTPIAKGQECACRMATSQPITFIWGPPGTGKTEVLAGIALTHLEKGHRVLMLSYSNVSVDGAILRVYDRDKHPVAGRLLRYGYPKDALLRGHEYLTSYNLVIRNHPDLYARRQALSKELKYMSDAEKKTPRYFEIKKELNHIRHFLEHEEQMAVHAAGFVATTVSKAVADMTVYAEQFDVVIFDEASMAYIPQIVFAAGLAAKHFICMGDFSQLPPIVQNGKSSGLNADIFRYCGITDAVEGGIGHKWLCLLDTQYRMHPDIADFVSVSMYHSLLHSASGMKEKRADITNRAPLSGCAIGLADLSGMMTVCTQTADSSRVNPLSAMLAFGLALRAAEHHEVGIITPYHAQSRLFHAMARDMAEHHPELHAITCATVHQFQGSEKDVIIYDAVDCYRQKFPGVLLTSTNNNYANRLFNVAMTRARGKFLAVANVDFMENKHLSQNLMFTKLMNRYRHKPQSIEGCEFSRELSGLEKMGYSYLSAQQAEEVFLRDLAAAKKDIRMEIPGSMTKDSAYAEKLAAVIAKSKAAGVTVLIRAENIKMLPVCLKPFAIQNPFVANAVTVIDKKTVWFGGPLSQADFITEGLVLPTKYRSIIRFEGKHTATALWNLLEMDKTIDQSESEDGHTFAQYVFSHCICEHCGKPMKLKKVKKFFLACSGYPNCKNTHLVDPELIEEYLYSEGISGKHCPQCKTSLEAKIGPYGVYVQCCGLKPHTYSLDKI